ncbi:cytochrome P450 family protein [Amycolatopsis nigrescens]|uniref:cytochrome P450 family protein n=1 Tax=Amycolatopsis nigrescens TaxID=381445 RepID=UPI0003769890|nr:cytochrome P450 [Amycolatopsis nigrescens]
MTTTGPETFSLLDPELLKDPFGAYGGLRERAPLTRGVIPGLDPMWLVTRYEDVKLVMNDPRFVASAAAVPGADVPDLTGQMLLAGGIDEDYVPYLRATMSGFDGADHARLRRLVSRAFTARRVAELRPRVEQITEGLLDELPGLAEDGVTDLLRDFAYPLPITVICELVGVPEADRPRWRELSALIAPGLGPGMAEGVRGLVDDTRELIGLRRAEPAEDLISELIRAQDEDGDRLSDIELVTMVVSLVTAGHETTAHLIGNGMAALLTHPGQLALLRDDPGLLPRAVHELMRWCGPAIGTSFRYATEDLEIGGMPVRRGEALMPVLAAANHDPRAFGDPDRLDLTRDPDRRRETHVGFGHGPHYCLGAALARQEGEVAFGVVLRRFPGLALAVDPADLRRGPNPGSWQLAALPVRL